MAAYLVLARKYRPLTFDDVVGQEHVATTLVNAIKAERVAHAFLFTGTRGVGKTTMARILAKSLNCLKADAPTVKPCNKCDACLAVARGDDIDVVEIDGASNRGIDDIRELRANAVFHPNRCRYKIYYIDEVHQVTKDAFNALLKTLEEPPAHVKFIFATTEPGKIPATILSRCQRFDFRNIGTREIAAYLTGLCKKEKVKVDDAAVYRIARAGAGSMRDALSLLDQLLAAGGGTVAEDDVVRVLGTPGDERTASIVGAVVGGDPAGALGELDALLAAGITLESALGAVGEMFRHMMLAKVCGADSELIELPDSQREQVAELAGKLDTAAVVQAVAVCLTTIRGLHGLTSGRGLVEAALVRLAAADKFVDAASLVERLEVLGRGGGRPSAPTGAHQKKNVAPAPARPVARPAAEPAPVLDDPRWELDYLTDQWDHVVDVLSSHGHGQFSGLLRPAKVVALAGETLRLGYDEAHETIRQRAERHDPQMAAALGELFGREVRCEYVATGQAGEPVRRAGAAATLSSAQRAEIASDPGVKAVLDFFDGTLTDVRPEVVAAADAADDGED